MEQLAALGIGQLASGATVEVEQVEDHVVDRGLVHPGLDGGCRGQAHPLLDQLEARPALPIEGDHLAVDDRGAIGELLGE